MVETVGALRAELTAGISAFRRDLNLATRHMRRGEQRINRSLLSIRRAQGKVTKGFRAIKTAASAAGVALGVRYALQALKAARTTELAAQKVGVHVEALQELRFAARQNNVEQRTTDLALQRFSRRVGEANNGSGELLKTLQKYNIATRDANGQTRKTEAVLADLADVIRDADSEQEKLAISFKAFDSEGAALVNVLRNGSEGLKGYASQARTLGVVLDAEAIAKASEAARKFDELAQVMEARVTKAFADSADEIAAIGTAFVTAADTGVRAFVGLGRVIGETFAKIAGFRVAEDLAGRLEIATDKLAAARSALSSARTTARSGIDAATAVDIRGGAFAGRERAQARIPELQARVHELQQQVSGLSRELQLTQEGIISEVTTPSGAPGLLGQGGEGAGIVPTAAGGVDQQVDASILFREAWTEALQTIAEEQEKTQRAFAEAATGQTDAARAAASERISIEQDATRAIIGQRQAVAGATLGLLQVLGSKSRAFGIASIALEKALAVKRFLIQNRVAAELAFASQLVPGVPASLATAAAAKAAVLAQGRVGAGLIIATGALQGIQQFGGGADPGSAANPLFTQTPSSVDGSGSSGAAGFVGGGAAVIQIDTLIGSEEFVRNTLVPILEAEFGRDVVVIRQGTRQASVLTSGGG